MKLTIKDIEDIHKQISEWKIIPTKIMLDLETLHELFRPRVSWLYRYILKDNYFVCSQEKIHKGYQINLFNNYETRKLYLYDDDFNIVFS